MSLGISEEVIKKACELSMKAHECCDESKQYIYDECQLDSMATALFSFAGAWSVGDLFAGACSSYGETEIDLGLFPSLKSIGSQESALVNAAFLSRFKAFETSSLAFEVDGAVGERKQVVFAGHGLGGPMAILATLWFLEKYTRVDCIATPRCVTFGSPLVGNHIFPHAIRRENWSQYFIHFVIKNDIVPCIMFAPYFSVGKELQKVLDFLNPRSLLYKDSSICMSSEASSFVENVLTNLSSVASYVACNLSGDKNLLVDNFSSFMELSPYRPFGTYIFCTNNKIMVVERNSDAVLQLLSHSSTLQSRDEGAKFAGPILEKSLVYNDIFQRRVEEESCIFLRNASVEFMKTEKMTLDDLGLSLRAKLCLLAAVEFEKQKLSSETKIDKEEIIAKLDSLQEYCRNCEVRKVCRYDAFKIKANDDDFHAGVVNLQLGGMWNEIMEMLITNQLPDEFEGNKEWIELGTTYRRVNEPIAIGSYYSRGLNDDAGPFMIKGRSTVFKYTQRWLEHKEKLPVESISESCFWAEVEELMILGKKKSYDGLQERITSLERQILHWHEAGVLEDGVFFNKSTVTEWWKTLPQQHKSESCIRGLFEKQQ
ncbi:Zinc finger CCCH domain-containing protein 5-like [Heracleum sosnowskyi]|uniref:Zinc finger CCCH domain-containing protein 5-like n=1 Tax=Heracleum sosnowskyi TaxID=360622 RepID=A0AAD8HX60_9APIA|nr:Zinc finger CCCH domain-containing protein 5-like [Heracleum sosnowskyi]